MHKSIAVSDSDLFLYHSYTPRSTSCNIAPVSALADPAWMDSHMFSWSLVNWKQPSVQLKINTKYLKDWLSYIVWNQPCLLNSKNKIKFPLNRTRMNFHIRHTTDERVHYGAFVSWATIWEDGRANIWYRCIGHYQKSWDGCRNFVQELYDWTYTVFLGILCVRHSCHCTIAMQEMLFLGL